MLSLAIILAHLAGDYILQSDSMAQRKTAAWRWALVHAGFYTSPYAGMLFVLHGRLDWALIAALLVIGGTHAVIDRYRLAKHLIWAMNRILPHDARDDYPWSEARENQGYRASTPAWMRTWLMIIVDNTTHLVINAVTIGLLLVHGVN